MKFEKTKIYGVRGVGNSKYSTSFLPRTDDAVGLSYTRHVNGSTITIKSDFDNCYPWCDMQEIMDKYGNVFIKIPKFYAKITESSYYEPTVQDTVYEYQYQISGCRYNGFSTLFIDGKGNEIDYILVGKYEGSVVTGETAAGRLVSAAGYPVTEETDISTLRTFAKDNGAGYQLYDFLIDNILKLLFTVEFATTYTPNVSQYCVFLDETLQKETGNSKTSELSAPSCSMEDNFVLYRGIENLWGNSWTWCDGIRFNGSKEGIWVCTDPSHYGQIQETLPRSAWQCVGTRMVPPTEGNFQYVHIQPLDKIPLLQFACGDYNDESMDVKYFYDIDCYGYHPEGRYLLCGGIYSSSSGIWVWYDDYCVAMTIGHGTGGASGCGRLCYKPIV